jgi:hypothetical protein
VQGRRGAALNHSRVLLVLLHGAVRSTGRGLGRALAPALLPLVAAAHRWRAVRSRGRQAAGAGSAAAHRLGKVLRAAVWDVVPVHRGKYDVTDAPAGHGLGCGGWGGQGRPAERPRLRPHPCQPASGGARGLQLPGQAAGGAAAARLGGAPRGAPRRRGGRTCVLGLQGVRGRRRARGVDRAEAAAARAGVAQQHDGGGACGRSGRCVNSPGICASRAALHQRPKPRHRVQRGRRTCAAVPALADVGALRLLAHGGELEAPQLPVELLVPSAAAASSKQ